MFSSLLGTPDHFELAASRMRIIAKKRTTSDLTYRRGKVEDTPGSSKGFISLGEPKIFEYYVPGYHGAQSKVSDAVIQSTRDSLGV
jgi:hypothetical protein